MTAAAAAAAAGGGGGGGGDEDVNFTCAADNQWVAVPRFITWSRDLF